METNQSLYIIVLSSYRRNLSSFRHLNKIINFIPNFFLDEKKRTVIGKHLNTISSYSTMIVRTMR